MTLNQPKMRDWTWMDIQEMMDCEELLQSLSAVRLREAHKLLDKFVNGEEQPKVNFREFL